MQPWDLQVWKAIRFPTWTRKVPMTPLVCSREGSGVCSIRNADYDGDLLGFSNNQRLLQVAKLTAEGLQVPEIETAIQRATARAAKQRKHVLALMQDYRDFILVVGTMPVVCAVAEQLQQAVFASPDPRRDGALTRAIQALVPRLQTTARRSACPVQFLNLHSFCVAKQGSAVLRHEVAASASFFNLSDAVPFQGAS